MMSEAEVITQDDALLVGTRYVVAAEAKFGTDSAARPPDGCHVVATIYLVGMNTFVQASVLQIDDFRAVLVSIDEVLQVGCELLHTQHSSLAMHEIDLAVGVEEHRGVVIVTLES